MFTTPPPVLRARRRRQVSLTAVALGAAALLAGCASSTDTAGTNPAAGQTANSQTTAPASTRTPAGAAGTTAAMCQSTALKIVVNGGAAGGAAGSIYYPVDFTNISGSACKMYGYPGMSFVTANGGTGQQIGAAAQENPSYAKKPVQLAAGGVAHAWLEVAEAGNYPSSTCKPMAAHWLRVYAPGNTAAVYVNHSFSACSSANAPLLTVMPVRSGQGVQGTTP